MLLATPERQTHDSDSPSLNHRTGRPHVSHYGLLLVQGFRAAENVGPHLVGRLPGGG